MAASGDLVRLRFGLVNSGVAAREFAYLVSDARGWLAPAAGTVAVAPGDSAWIQAEFTIPSVGCTSDQFTFGVSAPDCAQTLATCGSYVSVHPQSPVVVSPPDTIVAAGDTVAVSFYLRNPNRVPVRFRFFSNSYPGFCGSTSGSPTIAAGDSIRIERLCVIPADAACGTEIEVTVSAGAWGCDLYYWAYGHTSIFVEAPSCVSFLSARDTSITVGVPVERRLCLVNCTPRPGDFDYAVQDSVGWCPPASGTLHVAAGDTVCVPVNCTAPEGVACAAEDVPRLVVNPRSCPQDSFVCTTRLFAAPRTDAIVPLALRAPAGAIGFGLATVMPGDLNGDGHDDFVVGASDPDASSAPGRVYVFFGGPAADANQDLVLTDGGPHNRYATALAGAGDLNGDGYPDLAVGAFTALSNQGRAYVYFGGPGMDSLVDLVLSGSTSIDEFGVSLDGPGDVNGDGFDDLLVGARYTPDIGPERGRMSIFFGGPNLDAQPDLVIAGQESREQFGLTVSRAGDLNGDGQRDFLVGAPYNSSVDHQAGRVYGLFGGPGLDAVPDRILQGTVAGAHFGVGLAAADVNGDAHPDVLVGSAPDANATGSVHVFFGGAAFDATADIVLAPPLSGDRFGVSLSGGADLDQDGWPDLVVGAPGTANGGPGYAFVYRGGPYLDSECEAILAGEKGLDSFGRSVAATGSDVNGDGMPDLLVGACSATVEPGAYGRAYVYSRLRPVPVMVQDWMAFWDGGAVMHTWRLDAEALRQFAEVRVQRADGVEGPYADRAMLRAQARMTFADRDVGPRRAYWYRLAMVDGRGAADFVGPLRVDTGAATIMTTALEVPLDPARGAPVRIRYRIGPDPARVRVDVHDIAGRCVRRFEEGRRESGSYVLSWDKRDGSGARVARGLYVVRLRAGGATATRKVVVAHP